MTASGPAGPPSPAVPPGRDDATGTADHGPAPAPPRGPGVAPPFVAPPTEGRSVRIWLGIGAAALGVLLFCGGGTAAFVGLAVSSMEAVKEQSRAVVRDYLDAITDERYGDAYRLLCDSLQQRESRAEFEQRVGADPEITDYRLGTPQLVENRSTTVESTLPVDVTYVDGDRERLQFRLVQDPSSAEMEVCGIS